MSTDSPGRGGRLFVDGLAIAGGLAAAALLVDVMINGYHWWSWFAWSGAGFTLIAARGDRTIYLVTGLALVLGSLLAIAAVHIF